MFKTYGSFRRVAASYRSIFGVWAGLPEEKEPGKVTEWIWKIVKIALVISGIIAGAIGAMYIPAVRSAVFRVINRKGNILLQEIEVAIEKAKLSEDSYIKGYLANMLDSFKTITRRALEYKGGYSRYTVEEMKVLIEEVHSLVISLMKNSEEYLKGEKLGVPGVYEEVRKAYNFYKDLSGKIQPFVEGDRKFTFEEWIRVFTKLEF